MIDIKDISGNIRLSVPVSEKAVHKKELMKEDYVLLLFNTESIIAFQKGDNIESESKRYEIVDLTFPSDSDTGYNYELKFDSPEKKWSKRIFFYNRQNQKEKLWSLTSTLANFMELICSNLKTLGYKYNGLDYTYSIGSDVASTSLYLSFDSQNIFDALTDLAEKWETEWWVTDNIIHFGKCEFGTETDFEEGVNINGMTRSEGDSTSYVTRLYPFGSTRNIPTNYRLVTEGLVVEGVVEKRLMLPSPLDHIDAWENMADADIVEGVVAFDDVYPKRIGTISQIATKEYTNIDTDDDGKETVTKWNAYIFKDSSFAFAKSYILPGIELKVTFQTGILAGMEFDIANFNETDQTFEIKRNDTYGINLPNDTLKPSVNDTYVLSGYDASFVSDTLIPAAEQELLSVAKDYLAKKSIDTSVYDCPTNKIRVRGHVNGIYSEANVQDFEVGQKVFLKNLAFLKTGRSSRVYGYEKRLDDKFNCTYTVGESTKYSRIGKIEEEVKSITYKGQAYTGTSREMYLITKYDATKATDSNVYSALRAKTDFLSKTEQDIAQKLIIFLEGLISDDIKSQKYTSGALGEGMRFWMQDGKSYGELDNLTVRMKTIFRELVIEKLSHVGGELVSSPGRMKCVRVEEQTNVYRCYFDRGTDLEVYNEFVVNDQARCQVFTSAGQKYYWRLVVAVGDDYIDLSKTDCDGTGVPTAGDDIVQLGNRSDSTRQNAQILSSYGPDAPSHKQYSGIHSYNLSGCELNVTSSKGNKLIGDLSVLSGGKKVRVPADRGVWSEGMVCNYYDRVSNKGALWLCVIEEGTTTTEEPSTLSEDWQKQVSEGGTGYRIEKLATLGYEFYREHQVYNHTLAVRVYFNEEDITETLNIQRFKWSRVSENTDGDPTWNELHANSGYKIEITGADLAGDTFFTLQFYDVTSNKILTTKF